MNSRGASGVQRAGANASAAGGEAVCGNDGPVTGREVDCAQRLDNATLLDRSPKTTPAAAPRTVRPADRPVPARPQAGAFAPSRAGAGLLSPSALPMSPETGRDRPRLRRAGVEASRFRLGRGGERGAPCPVVCQRMAVLSSAIPESHPPPPGWRPPWRSARPHTRRLRHQRLASPVGHAPADAVNISHLDAGTPGGASR